MSDNVTSNENKNHSKNHHQQAEPAQTTPSPAQPASSAAPVFSLDSFIKDKKLAETIKIFVIYGTLLYVANAIVGMIVGALTWFPYGGFINIGTLITAVILGVIFSAIGGVLFYYLYGPIHNWIKKNAFVSKYIYSMFTLFWRPFLLTAIINAIFALFAVLPSLGVGASPYGAYSAMHGATYMMAAIVISFVAHVVIYYYYSKAISPKLAPMYPW